MMKQDFRESALAWVLLTPTLLVMGTFGLFPIAYALYVSLHKWRIKKGAFVGIDHYVRAIGDPGFVLCCFAGALLLVGALMLRRSWGRSGASRAGARRLTIGLALAAAVLVALYGLDQLMATGDRQLYNGLKITVFFALGTIPVQLTIALALAYLLFKSWRGKGFFRVLFFLPYVTPVIASAVVFRAIFSPHPSSLANRFWGLFGMTEQRWLFESKSVPFLILQRVGVQDIPLWVNELFPSLALICVIFYNVWVYIGYDTVILLAGLSAIPAHYYEAAEIDGAGAWHSFRHVTLPLVSPTLFFLSVVAVIGTFKAFNHIYILRTPGAQDTLDVLSIGIFDQIFQNHDAGYASTLAFILFVVILALTLLQRRIFEKRVFYGD